MHCQLWTSCIRKESKLLFYLGKKITFEKKLNGALMLDLLVSKGENETLS